jgi:hypothetical protein
MKLGIADSGACGGEDEEGLSVSSQAYILAVEEPYVSSGEEAYAADAPPADDDECAEESTKRLQGRRGSYQERTAKEARRIKRETMRF